MGKHVTKAAGNVFAEARYQAATFNDRLFSREGASEELGIDRSRLARIELGSKNPFPDVKLEALDRISIKALSSFRKISAAKELLLDITEDGVITENEKGDLNEIIKTLDEVSRITQSLKIWAEKNLE